VNISAMIVNNAIVLISKNAIFILLFLWFVLLI
jgi:hypothetical protein